MKVVDFLLHPGTLLALAAIAIFASSLITGERMSSLSKTALDGYCGGLFVFASAALIAAAIRRSQIQGGGKE